MADVFSKAKRSAVMARIRSRGNKDTEVALAKLFRRHKITGWRRQVQIVAAVYDRRGSNGAHRAPLQSRKFSVRPDFIFPKCKLALFVDGCFWHGCPRHGTKPKNNRKFWKNKFARNRARDRLVTQTLRRTGWRVLRIWEHDLHRATKRRATMKPENEARLLRRIQRALEAKI